MNTSSDNKNKVAANQSKATTHTKMKKKRRKGRKKSNSNTFSSSSKRNANPVRMQLPHVKITLRNITDVERHGTCPKLVLMVQSVIESFNEKLHSELSDLSTSFASDVGGNTTSTFVPLVLDESSIKYYLQPDEVSTNEDNDHPTANMVNIKTNDDKENENEAQDSTVQEEKSERRDNPKENEPIPVLESNDAQKNALIARLLYMVPPRKSRRRGLIPGCVYLVIHPPIPVFEKVHGDTIHHPNATETKGTTNSSVSKANEGSTGIMTETRVPTPSERSRLIAQSRLLLRKTVSLLGEVCKIDSNKMQRFGCTQVVSSLSQKTWKVDVSSPGGFRGYGHYFAKYESTIQHTEDFKLFLEEQVKSKEELLTRPKPSPGGGAIPELATTSAIRISGDESTVKAAGEKNIISKDEVVNNTNGSYQQTLLPGEAGKPMSALLVHLRETQLMKQKSKSSKKGSVSNGPSTTEGSKRSKQSSSGLSGGTGKTKLSSSGKSSSVSGKRISSKKGEKRERKKKLDGLKERGDTANLKRQHEKSGKKSSAAVGKHPNPQRQVKIKKSEATTPAVIAPPKILKKIDSGSSTTVK